MKIGKKEIKYTAVIVAIFVAVFLWGRSADAAELRLGLAAGTFNTQGAVTQDLMLTSTDLHWYANISRWGGDARGLDEVTRFSGGYRVNWRRDKFVSPFLRLGVAYFDQEPMPYVSDNWTFDMGAGLRFNNILELEAQHNSTAGRSRWNTGLDNITLAVVLPFGASK